MDLFNKLALNQQYHIALQLVFEIK